IEIKKFQGDPKQWHSFWDAFSANIHESNKLTVITKFTYLKSKLEDRALRVIQHLKLLESNYSIAIEELQRHFGNARSIASSFVSQVEDLPKCHKSSSPEELIDITTTIRQTCHGLDNLGSEYKNRDVWILHMLKSRVEAKIWLDFEEKRKTDAPDLNEFLEFIEKYAHNRQNVRGYNDGYNELDNYKKTTKNIKSAVSQTSDSKGINEGELNKQIAPPCPICKVNHYLNLCSAYQEMSVTDRRRLVNDAKLCFNCLSKSHMVSNCQMKSSCRVCQKRHHTTLHNNDHNNHAKQESQPCSKDENSRHN
ncbi:UNVERIFIED_CONTAM: hypothetical protein B566_EDAN019054, partial [Ephemera danica]